MQTALSLTGFVLRLPIDFLHWWFIEATKNLLKILLFILAASIQLLGIRSIFQTFFHPWKNEYREGLVGFSVFMGVFFKSLFLVINTFIILIVVFLETTLLVGWLLLPLIALGGIYAGFFA